MKIGYVCSTNIESTKIQVLSLSQYGVDKIFIDRNKSLSDDRPELAKMIGLVKPGDIIVLYAVEALGNKCEAVVSALNKLENNKVNVVSVSDGFNNIPEILDYIENGIGKYVIKNCTDIE